MYGHTTFNVGRGDVYFENNSLDDASGAGLTLRTSQNPSSDASIFSVRSSGHMARLWVGQEFSSFGANDFYFGGETAGRKEQDKRQYKSILKQNGRVGINTRNPERPLHIRGMARIDRNEYQTGILFANFEPDWSSAKSSGVITVAQDGTFEIRNLLGNLGGENYVNTLSIDGESYDVKIPHSLSVGADAVKIDGAIAHFDGRVYVSEEDNKVDPEKGESTTENGFKDKTHDIYKDYVLWLEGGVVSNEIAILNTKEWWPDYVFNKDYDLISIKELKTYIKKYSHLPSMPSAKEVKENGVLIADITKRTLKVVEEMSLYIITHDEDLDSLQTESELRIAHLKNLLDKSKK